jgi:hypothetical protein
MPVTILGDAGLDAHVSYSIQPETSQKFMQEVNRFANTPAGQTMNRNFANFPTVQEFAFLLCSSSRAALRLARRFRPLPCPKTVHNDDKTQVKTENSALSDINQLDDQIRAFVAMDNFPDEAFMSVGVEAMAMTPDRSYLRGKGEDHCFVTHGEPLDRRFKSLPLHVVIGDLRQVTPTVRQSVDAVCAGCSPRGFVVKHVCTDGDPRYSESHNESCAEWYPLFIEGGLPATLEYVSSQTKLRVGDFLHMWKCFCNRVKNHTVILCPDSLHNYFLSADTLETILKLDAALWDRSSIGKMGDSCALQLFSLENCLRCFKEKQVNELMDLLPWAL